MELDALTHRAQHITLTSSDERQFTLTLDGP
jgi:hypothetical protein